MYNVWLYIKNIYFILQAEIEKYPIVPPGVLLEEGEKYQHGDNAKNGNATVGQFNRQSSNNEQAENTLKPAAKKRCATATSIRVACDNGENERKCGEGSEAETKKKETEKLVGEYNTRYNTLFD